MRRLIVLCVPLLLAWSQGVHAQASSPIRGGARVRVTGSDLGVRGHPVGTVATLGADTLVMQPDHHTDPLRIPVAQITKLEVSSGKKSRVVSGIGRGALIGFAAGAVFGGVVGGAARAAECSGCGDTGVVGDAFTVGLVGAAAGAVLGGIIGATETEDRWEEVPSDRWYQTAAPREEYGRDLAASDTP